MSAAPNRVVGEEMRHLDLLGWSLVDRKGGHIAFTHPDYGRILLASTPAHEEQWRQNFRTQLARKMRLSRAELDKALGIERIKRHGPKVRRQRNDAGRAARTFTVVKAATPPPVPSRVGTVQERMSEVAEEIAAVDVGLTYRTGEEYDSLLSERCRLRREYLQIEADAKAETRAAA